MSVSVETVIVGAGQAGLAISHYLSQRGREHVILERGRVAERWRSERWDSLYFQFPNWMMRLPGQSYEGADPDEFTHRDGVVRYIADYAKLVRAPLRCGVNVTSLRQAEGGRLRVQAESMVMTAANVVVATGPYQRPTLPSYAAKLHAGLCQLTASRYTSSSELPPGGALVVGSGASGCQIVEDLLLHGRTVYHSVRGHRRVPRRYRGRDIGWWNEEMGLTNRTVETLPPGFRPPLITGYKGGHTIDLRELAQRGVRLLGSLLGVEGDRLYLADDLNSNLDAGDEQFRQTILSIDAYIDAKSIAAPAAEELDKTSLVRPRLSEISSLSLREADINTVIWALGYSYDFSWIGCDVFDSRGAPIQRRGITAVPGLYFLGLSRMHKVKSAFLWGVGEDAEFLAERIAERSVS